MKRLTFIVVLVISITGLLLITNCSRPLESITDSNQQSQIDTVYIFDTLMNIDTIIIIDSLNNFDTIYILDTIVNLDTIAIVDTVIIIDTVYITIPDSGLIITDCQEFSSKSKEISWHLDNSAGNYRLTFEIMPEKDDPEQSLEVEIDEHEYHWDALPESVFIVEMFLKKNTHIEVESHSPHAYGHSLKICLTVERL